MCEECYSDKSRITPLLNTMECLESHTQYVCGTCGRCICIECDERRGLQRWNFPFKTVETAKLYLRTADYTMKKSCGIYEIKNDKGRVSYKIFSCVEELERFLKINKNKFCDDMVPLFFAREYREFANTEIRRLNHEEIKKYLSEQKRNL